MNFTPEQINKAKQTKTAEELLKLAKENGVALTEEQAKQYYAELHKEGELSDDELVSVAGGGKGDPPAAKYKKDDLVDTYFGVGIVSIAGYNEAYGEWYYNVHFGPEDVRLLKESEMSLHN